MYTIWTSPLCTECLGKQKKSQLSSSQAQMRGWERQSPKCLESQVFSAPLLISESGPSTRSSLPLCDQYLLNSKC